MASRRAKRNALTKAIDHHKWPQAFYDAKWSNGTYDPLGDVLRVKAEAIRKADEWARDAVNRTKWHDDEIRRKLALRVVTPPPAD